MKGSMFVSHFSFARAMPVALAILALGGRGACFSNQNFQIAAFSGSNMKSAVRKSPRCTSSLCAGRDSSIHEWISYLEEEFNKSDGNEGESSENNYDNNSNSPDKDDLYRPEKPRPFQTPVITVTNPLDLLDQVDKAPPNDLTVILFFAHYCKTCQRAFVPYKQVANTSSAKGITFFRFETSSLTPKQFYSLGIDRVPFLQIYRNGICVSSFSATQKISKTSSRIVLRPRLLEQIDACQGRSLTDWSAFRDKHDVEIEGNKAARAKIRETTLQHGARDTSDDEEDMDEEERLYRSVRTLTSESELLDLLKDDRKNDGKSGMVAIMFHSHFDPSCVRAQHKFRKIAIERQQRQQHQQNKRDQRRTASCTMARIEASILPDKTLKSLGIQKYPHIQIYWNSSEGATLTKQCVASFSIPRSFLFAKLVHESLDAIDQRTPEEWAVFYNRHKKEIESQQLALEGIVQEREQ